MIWLVILDEIEWSPKRAGLPKRIGYEIQASTSEGAGLTAMSHARKSHGVEIAGARVCVRAK